MLRLKYGILVGIAIVLMATGCNLFTKPVALALQQYDLRSTVKSHSDGRPYIGALVRVVQTGDRDYTDINGQTDWLATPRGAQWCDVFVSSTDDQIQITVRVGLSRDPNANQPTIYLTPRVPGTNEHVRTVDATTLEILDANGAPVATLGIQLRPHID